MSYSLRRKYIIWPLTKFAWNVAKYTQHHVTNADAKLEASMSNN